MRKELMVFILAAFMISLFVASITTASPGTVVSVDPRLIQDDQIKPGAPSVNSYPSAHAYNHTTVTNPTYAYDKSNTTCALINITDQPYPGVNSYPSTHSGNATVTDPTKAYDKDQLTYALIDITAQPYPGVRNFTVKTFNSTTMNYGSLDIKMNYNVTVYNCTYRILAYVGSKSTTLQSWTNTNQTIPTLRVWTGVTEPNDGFWSKTDLDNMRVIVETNKTKSTGRGTFREYETWARVFSPNVRYFDVRAFNSTTINAYSSLDIKMNHTIIIANCSYRILVYVGSVYTTLQSWVSAGPVYPTLRVWTGVTEPNDGFWNKTDLDNMQIIVETQKTNSIGNGIFQVYETWAVINPPTVNSYPSTHANTATVTNPIKAYDKNQITYALIDITSQPDLNARYFAVRTFNSTTIKDYAAIDLQMRYNATVWNCQYKIILNVGSANTTLQILSNDNQTIPTLRVWKGVIEPNDGFWNKTDLDNMQIIVETKKTKSTGRGTFREYETWASIPGDSFTVKINVSDVTDLVLWQFNLTFNPHVLQAVTAWEGSFLKTTGPTSVAAGCPNIDNSRGFVLFGYTLKDYGGGGASGSGLLATVAFKAIAKGNSYLNFSKELTRLRTWDGEVLVPIPHDTTNGYFQYLAGDANGDGKVDASDLFAVGEAYGSALGKPNWNPECDFNKDNNVDKTDLSSLSNNYGKS